MKLKHYIQAGFLTLCVSLIFQTALLSQETIQNQLSKYMQSVRADETSFPTPGNFYLNDQPEEVLDVLQSYYNDSVPDVRRKAYYITYKLGLKHEEAAETAVRLLTEGLKDDESGLVGNVATYLTDYKKTVFPESAKDTLVAILKRGAPHYKKIVKLAGYLDVEEGKKILKTRLRQRNYSTATEKWAIYTALARMGEESAIEYCLEIARKLPVNDDFVYEIAPDLIYTRQKPLINYLIELLHSNEKNCSTPNPEQETEIRCGYRIMEQLTPIVNNFPLKVDAAGEIETDDYRKALRKSRKWFKQNKDNYQIIRNTY